MCSMTGGVRSREFSCEAAVVLFHRGSRLESRLEASVGVMLRVFTCS